MLAGHHDVEDFRCRSQEQTEWLRRHARQSSGAGSVRVLVTALVDSGEVAGYYAWCMASVDLAGLPARMRKGVGRYPQPVALLARLGVDERHEGRGLGAGLFRDVIARARALSDQIGCRGLIVHAESSDAAGFYRHLVPEIEPSPTDELHLFLRMKDIRRTMG